MTRVVIVLGLAVLASAAQAQPIAPKANGPSTQASPPLPDTGIAASASPSVIHPGNPDPGMAVRPPNTGITPVVPPPGTNGSNQTLIPK